MSTTLTALAVLLLAAVGLSTLVIVIAGVAWLSTSRRPGAVARRQRRTAGPLLDRTEPWA